MKKILLKIANFAKTVVKNRYFKSAFIVLALTLPMVALAQTPPAAPSGNADTNKIFQEVVNLLVMASEFIQRLIWPVLLLIGSLMKNDILFGGGMEDRILAVWYVIRNFVNILMVLVLLGIALYNVAGGKAQDYHLKAILPKFVIALIAVNFSYAMVKIAIDSVNVLSTAIFAMPASVETGFGEKIENIFAGKPTYESAICQGLYGQGEDAYHKSLEKATESGGFAFCNDTLPPTLTDQAKLFFNKFDGYNAGIILAVNMMQVDNLNKVNVNQATLKDLSVNIIFSTFLYIIYGTAFIALFIILLVRLVVIWLGLVLSPLMVLPTVLPEKIKSSLGGGDVSQKMIQNIIAPIPISVVMTLSFILLTGLQKSSFPAGSLGTSASSVGLMLSGYSTLQQLIVAVGTVAFLWIGIFKAASGTAAEKLVNGLKTTVEGAGKFALSSVKYAPIFPVQVGQPGSGGKSVPMSIAGLQAGLNKYQQGRNMVAEKQAESLFGEKQKQELFAAENLARTAKDHHGVKQALDAGGNSMAGQKNNSALMAIGDAMKKDPNLRTNYDWSVHILSKDKKKELKPEEVVELMRNGKGDEIDPESFEKWRQKNKETYVPPASKDKGKPDQSATGGVTSELAEARIKNNGAYMSVLSADEKKAVDTFSKAKDQKGKDAAAKDQKFQSAMKKLQDASNGELAFNLDRFSKPEDLAAAIDARKKALTQMFKDAKMSEKDAMEAADKAIAADLSKTNISADGQKLIDQTPIAKEYQAKGKAAAPVAAPAKPGAPAKGGPAQPAAPPAKKEGGSGPPTADPPKGPVGPVAEPKPGSPANGSGMISPGGKWKSDSDGNWIPNQ